MQSSSTVYLLEESDFFHQSSACKTVFSDTASGGSIVSESTNNSFTYCNGKLCSFALFSTEERMNTDGLLDMNLLYCTCNSASYTGSIAKKL